MKIVGTIMEVNPFHNGHKFFLQKIRELEPNSIIIVLVSTTVVQRGEISVVPKHVKKDKLLENEADIVIEFPSIYANQGGEYFAKYAIDILADLGITTFYCGSESGDLKKIRQILQSKNNKQKFNEGYLKEQLKDLKSNDVLMLSYLKEIEKKENIILKPIDRVERIYEFESKRYLITSASKLREKLKKKDEDLNKYLDNEIISSYTFIDFNIFNITLINKLLISSNKDLKNIFLSEDGELLYRMRNIVLNKSDTSLSFNDLINLCKDKNNSKYKYQRIAINLLFNIKNQDIFQIDNQKYFLLGYSVSGKKYLSRIKTKIFTNYKNKSNLYQKNDEIDRFLSVLGFKDNYETNYRKNEELKNVKLKEI